MLVNGWLETRRDVTQVLLVVWVRSHWIPLQLLVVGDTLHVSSWDATALPKTVELLCEVFCECLGCQQVSFRLEKRGFGVGDLCGVCSVRFLDHILRGKMLPTNQEEALHLHRTGRAIFLTSLLGCPAPRRPWKWSGCCSSEQVA